MKRGQHIRRLAYGLCIITCILLLIISQWPQAQIAIAARAPEGEVRAAWRRAQEIGQYQFTSELVQTTHPGPALVNVGRSSETDVLYMEGEANLPADQLHLALWDDEGSAFNPQHAVNGLVIRRNITAFSDWTVGNDVNPTVVTLSSLGARVAAHWLPALALVALAGWFIKRHGAA